MKKLLKIDFDFRERIKRIVETCSALQMLMLSCFWGEHYFKEICFDISLKDDKTGEVICRGPCLVGKFFQDIREGAQPFLEYLHQLYNTIEPAKRYHFLMFVTIELSDLYSVNNKRVPPTNEEFVKEMMKTPIPTIARELTQLDSLWISEVYESAVSKGLDAWPWHCFLKLANIFIKAMYPTLAPIESLNTPEEKYKLHQAIDKFLKLNI